jgi:hypothetical protein
VIFLTVAILAIAVHRAMLWDSLSGVEQNMVYTRLDARSDALLVGCIIGILISRDLIPNRNCGLAGGRAAGPGQRTSVNLPGNIKRKSS